MDKENELPEFDLEDILNEFHDPASDEPAPQMPDADPEEPSTSAVQIPVQPVDEPAMRFPDLSALEADPDTAPEVQSQTAPQAEIETVSEDTAEAGEDALGEISPQVPDEAAETAETPQTAGDVTIVFDAPEHPGLNLNEDAPPIQEQVLAEDAVTAAAPAAFIPRSRLKELKKKLVAGPEKRYYELSEIGFGPLQMAIIGNLLVVLVCAGVTTLFTLEMVPENRLRLVIFSQVLALLLSGFFGSHLMLDSLGSLLHGRFGVNTLLTLTFVACLVDAGLCLKELRVPCCAAFSLEMTMALWARYQRRSTETAQMDTLRKAVRLHGIAREKNFWKKMDGLLLKEGEVEDFMDDYTKMSAPEMVQSVYAGIALILCIAIAVFAGLLHGWNLAVQILATSLLVAVPASFFVSISRPTAILETRLHMVGSVICGWKGVKGLCGKAAYPLKDRDLFPQGSTKLNGVKFYSDRNPDEIISFSAALIKIAGGALEPVFRQLLTSRNGMEHVVEHFQNYGGGIGGEVCGEPVLMGSLDFMQDMGVSIPDGTMVSQAVYTAIDGQLCAVYAITYAKMRSAAAGLVTLSGYRRLVPIMLCNDFMLTQEFIGAKFGIKTKRIVFPTREERAELMQHECDPEAATLALTTREELVGAAYAVTGARALRLSTRLGVVIHLIGGILGLLIMLVLAYLGSTELLTPANILLYQLVWAVPGLLVTEWTRAV